MGNCQAAEATAVVIHHPSGSSGGVGGGGRRVDRAHGAVSAAAVMAANPGHYVAAVIPASTTPTASGRQTKAPSATRAAPLRRRLKLLRPDDTLMVGGVYRLVSFEDVLTLFVSKRRPTPIHVEIPADDEDQDHRRRHGGPPEPGTPPAKVRNIRT
ncbi:hypothetical protein GUJ93_ZPchr0012g19154 [Zizania palustris]|uniref:Uncharacterized protein n=1 Tax=Zizania palustris TaxID=103762 RepID=A0A8J5WMV2_ZIZPA|nr:hypothetical protein GUJ93_ZPchr0012g19154 [Zizania palustris]